MGAQQRFALIKNLALRLDFKQHLSRAGMLVEFTFLILETNPGQVFIRLGI